MNHYEETRAVVEDLLKMNSVTYETRYINKVKRDSWNCDQWEVNFKFGKNTERFDYYTGLGHRQKVQGHLAYSYPQGKPTPPKIADVLHSLILDSSAVNICFDYWCVDFGYSNDSMQAFKTYQACCENAKKLSKILNRATLDKLEELLQDY